MMRENRRMGNKHGTLLQRSLWRKLSCTGLGKDVRWGGEKWEFNLLENRTELCVVRGGIIGDNRDADCVLILVDSVLMDGRQKGYSDDDVDADEYSFGFDLILGGSDGFVSFLRHVPGAVDCADRFTNMSRDMTSERIGVRKREGGGTKGPPRIF